MQISPSVFLHQSSVENKIFSSQYEEEKNQNQILKERIVQNMTSLNNKCKRFCFGQIWVYSHQMN